MNGRIIKFRAWDKEHKIMLKWHPNADAIKEAIPFDGGDEWTERCDVMQFTGLLDKNGKEIYEGDIIEYTEILNNFPSKLSCLGKIIYGSQGDFCMEVLDKTMLVIPIRRNFSLVIGNIFEDSNLLGYPAIKTKEI